MTAARNLINARNEAKRLKGAITRAETRLAEARDAGDQEKAALAEASLRRMKGSLRRAKLQIAKLEPVARSVASALGSALKLEPRARARDEQNQKDRRNAGPTKTAADRTHKQDVLVDSPYGREHGVDQVVRVFHTIEWMRKFHHIDERQKMAADRYRWAYEACPSSIRCALDTSGRGGSTEMRSPTDDQAQAVEWLLDASRLLGVTDGLVVQRICGEGMSIEDLGHLSPGKSLRESRRVNRDRLRTGLTVLAAHWWPERNRLRSERGEGAKPSSAEARDDWNPGDFKGRVAHATAGMVYGYQNPEGHPDLRLKPVRGKRSRQGDARR